MRYLYTLMFYIFVKFSCFGQKTEYHISIGPNISLSSFNDKIYKYPSISPNTAFFSYRQLPPNIYRKTLPKIGLQVQGNVFYQIKNNFAIGTGLKFLLYRHGYNKEFKDNPFDPYGKRWSNETNNVVYPETNNKIHSRILYASIPFLINYQMTKKVYYYTGINFSTPILVVQKHKSLSMETNQTSIYPSNLGYHNRNITFSYSERTLTDKSKSAFNKVNYGLQLGIGYKTSIYTSIKFDFNHNINNTYSNTWENNGIKSLIRTFNFSYDCLLDL